MILVTRLKSGKLALLSNNGEESFLQVIEYCKDSKAINLGVDQNLAKNALNPKERY